MYFWDDEKNELADKCPKCEEEFTKGFGPSCANNCEDRKLEEKHRGVVKPMVNTCLPKFKANVYTPSDTEITEAGIEYWGWSYDYSRTIYIPWYTLRSKKEFFDTVAHESGHILAYEEKFTTQEEKTILKRYNELLEEYDAIVNEYDSLPLLTQSKLFSYYEKTLIKKEQQIKEYKDYSKNRKKIIEKYETRVENGEPSKWAHGERYFYPAYVKCFKGLLGAYAIYNYNNSSSPKSFDEVRDYKPKSNKN
jgi:hypothetical protein